MKTRTALILSVLAISLAACASTKYVEVDRVHLNAPDPDPIIIDDVEWIVVTPQNAQEILKQNGNVLFAVAQEDYKRLNNNTLKIAHYIKQATATINAYRNYYEQKK